MVALDLMDDYDRDAVRSRWRRHHLSPVQQEPRHVVSAEPLAIQPGESLDLTPTTTVILGDGAEMMRNCTSRMARSMSGRSMRRTSCVFRPEESVTDYYLELNGEKPRFREDWDNFSSIRRNTKSSVASGSIEADAQPRRPRLAVHPRCAHQHQHHRSACSSSKASGSTIDIAWIKRNSRPNVCRTRLQHSNESVIWAVKNPKEYRFNYRRCKMYDDPRDYFSERGRQMRDVWDIRHAARQRTSLTEAD